MQRWQATGFTRRIEDPSQAQMDGLHTQLPGIAALTKLPTLVPAIGNARCVIAAMRLGPDRCPVPFRP